MPCSYSWLVTICLWFPLGFVHVLFIALFMALFMALFLTLVPDLFMAFSWLVYCLLMRCSWPVCNLFIDSSFFFLDWSMFCSQKWLVHNWIIFVLGMFMTYHYSFIAWTWVVHGNKTESSLTKFMNELKTNRKKALHYDPGVMRLNSFLDFPFSPSQTQLKSLWIWFKH